MITYFWAIGIVFTIFIFAVKAGLVAGSMNIRTSAIVALALLYGVLSFLMGVAIKIVNPLDYFQFFQKFMSHGVILHFFISIGLIAWGLYTMKTALNDHSVGKSKAGYLLMLPCPVCLSAMLLSSSIFVALTGVDPLEIGGLMAVLFTVGIAGIALIARGRMKRDKEKRQGPVLFGFIMTIVGLYFAVAIIVVPVYSKAKALLAMRGIAASSSVSFKDSGMLLLVGCLIFCLGFIKNHREILRNKKIKNEV
jgi:predicted transporter